MSAETMSLWDFLNADSSEVSAGIADEEVARDVRQIHGALRVLYQFVANPDRFRGGEGHELLGRAHLDLRVWYKHASPALPIAQPPQQAEAGRFFVWGSEMQGLPANLSSLIGDALQKLHTVVPNSVFVCEHCGRIGPAERSSKRYCNGSCRSLSSRERRRT